MNSRAGFVLFAVSILVCLTFANFEVRKAEAQSADGKAVYLANCAACHQATGLGGGPFPPLAGNADVTAADTSNLIGTVLNGRAGPITVNGKQYGGYAGGMPAWRGKLSSAQIAAVLSYIRSSWGNSAPAVSEDQVAAAAAPVALSGAALFAARCASCHQPSGQGTLLYPPLAGNPDVVAADPKNMIATIVNGRSGQLTVNGKTFEGRMPTWKGTLSNAEIAAVATYVRSSWGNSASAVTEQQVIAAGEPVAAAVGASIYSKHCAACHSANGEGGGGGLFPALAHDKVVNAADPTAMLTTILHGRNAMPTWKGQLSASDIAAVATFVRSSWGNSGGAVSVDEVSAIK